MQDIRPFVASGLALGGIYALSGVGLVVLFRTTGVINFAYGALGALSGLLCWQLTSDGVPAAVAYVTAVVAATVVSLLYGTFVNPLLARRDTAVRASGSLGLALVLLGGCTLIWGTNVSQLQLPLDNVGFAISTAHVTGTEVAALVLAIVLTTALGLFLRMSLMGTSMRALATDRELTALLGVPARRLELVTWSAVGVLAGVSGLLLSDLVTLQAASLTFLVITALAAAVVGQLSSLVATFVAGVLIGVLQACATPINAVTEYRDAVPFVVAIVALIIVDAIKGIRGGRPG
jgi:branched-chain amino acid transport system permease protein